MDAKYINKQTTQDLYDKIIENCVAKLSNVEDQMNELISYNSDKSTVVVSPAEKDTRINSTIDDNGDANSFIGPDDSYKTDPYRQVYKAQVQKMISGAMTESTSFQNVYKYFGIKSDIDTIAEQPGHPFLPGDKALGTDALIYPTYLKLGVYADTTDHYETQSVTVVDGGDKYLTNDVVGIGNNAVYVVAATQNGRLETFDTTAYTNVSGNFEVGDTLEVEPTASGAESFEEWTITAVRTDSTSGYTVPDIVELVGQRDSHGYEIGDEITLSDGVNTLTTTVTSVTDGIITSISIRNAGDVSTDFAGTGIALTGGTGSGATVMITTINQKTGAFSWTDAQPSPKNGMFTSINNYIDSTTSYQWRSATVLYLNDGANPVRWVVDQTSVLIFQMEDGLSTPSYYHGSKVNAHYDISSSQYATADVIYIRHFGALITLDKNALDMEDKYAIGDDNWVYKFTYDSANNRLSVVYVSSDHDVGWKSVLSSTTVSVPANVWTVFPLSGTTDNSVAVPYDGLYLISIRHANTSTTIPSGTTIYLGININGTLTDVLTTSLVEGRDIIPYCTTLSLKQGDAVSISVVLTQPNSIIARQNLLSVVLLNDAPIQFEPDVFFKATIPTGTSCPTGGWFVMPLTGNINAGLINTTDNSFLLPKGKYIVSLSPQYFGSDTAIQNHARYISPVYPAGNGPDRIAWSQSPAGPQSINVATEIVESDGVRPFKYYASINAVDGVTVAPIVIRAYRLPNTNSDLMNKPNLWVPGVEYDFGDGVYGQRYTGTITVDANVRSEIYINDAGNVDTIVSCGGSIEMAPNKHKFMVGVYDINGFSTGMFTYDGKVAIESVSPVIRSGYAYDVWLTYTKTNS
jgi:hypothetical protein